MYTYYIITFRSNPTLALEMQEELLNHELDNILRTKQLKKYMIIFYIQNKYIYSIKKYIWGSCII
ncbi:hypothetical protein [Plasmodium yoelii yoelii]|uniref:Uncharacterized protein n=1 Tax=Plasmodium yoelii yoelii TaxID=73239 RepID=Q7RQU8_PLAYO|nr:hypothetical protein [Plasmodium yoelii yoelii]